MRKLRVGLNKNMGQWDPDVSASEWVVLSYLDEKGSDFTRIQFVRTMRLDVEACFSLLLYPAWGNKRAHFEGFTYCPAMAWARTEPYFRARFSAAQGEKLDASLSCLHLPDDVQDEIKEAFEELSQANWQEMCAHRFESPEQLPNGNGVTTPVC